MRLQGIVRNVVAFGAFVDVGVGHDGLLHAAASVETPCGNPRSWTTLQDELFEP